MKCVVILLIAAHAILCSGTAQPSPYSPYYGYGVPVASQPIVYGGSAVTTAGPYVGSYAVHSPAVSHSYSTHTQTHPVSYVRPVTYYGGASSSYYAPAYGPSAYGYGASAYSPAIYSPAAYSQYYSPAASSHIQQSRLIIPQTNRIYRYRSNEQYNAPRSGQLQQSDDSQGAQPPTQNIHIRIQSRPAEPQSARSQYRDQYNDQYRDQQYNPSQMERNVQILNDRRGGNNYARNMPYTNNGEQTKLRRYQIHRPGIQKEFYDVEERTIVRPAGTALIELDPPTKKQDITNYEPQQFDQQRQYGQGGGQGGQGGGQIPDCGYGPQTPVYEYGPPSIGTPQQTPQYHPTTFLPPTNSYPTTRRTNSQPTYPTYPSYPTTTSGSYPTTTSGYYPTTIGSYPTTIGSSYPTTTGSYPTTVIPAYTTNDQSFQSSSSSGQFTPSTTISSSQSGSVTPGSQQSDIYISSTTPVSVTIVDKNENGTKGGGSVKGGQRPIQGGGQWGQGGGQGQGQGGGQGGGQWGQGGGGQGQGSGQGGGQWPTKGQRPIQGGGQWGQGGGQGGSSQGGGQEGGQWGQGQGGGQWGQGRGGQGQGQGGGQERDDGQWPVQFPCGEEETPDQVQNELPPRGDLSQYQAEQTDEFYHELPRGRYTNQPQVDVRSRGEPQRADYYQDDAEEFDNFQPQNNQKQGSRGNDQQARLIELYTGNDGVAEIGQVDDDDDNFDRPDQNRNNQYRDGNRNGQYRNGDRNDQYRDDNNNNNNNNRNGRYQDFRDDSNQNGRYQNNQYRDGDRNGQYRSDNQYQDNNNNRNGQYQNENRNGQYRNGNENNQYRDGNRNNNQYEDNNRNGQYQDGNRNGQFRDGNQNRNQDVGNVRARVIAVTPPPATAIPTETVNRRRIVVSKPVTTVQTVVEADNSTSNGQRDNYENGQRGNSNNRNYNNGDNRNNYRDDNNNTAYNGNYRNNDNARNNFDQKNDINYARSSNDKANYEDSVSSTTPSGVYISTTPTTASQRIIYVQPVSQAFASQKAVEPKKQ